jgi:hypothetical protein
MAVITTAQFKTYASITVTTWDTLLGVLIPAAQADAERFCNRSFDTATYTELHDGDNAGRFVLKNAPITSITSVKYVAVDGTKTALPSTLYGYVSETGELSLVPLGVRKSTSYDSMGAPYASSWSNGPAFVRGVQNYEVIYVGGYSSMPADLQLAMYQYVDELFAPIKNGAAIDTSLASETIGDYSYTRKSGSEQLASMQRRFGKFRRAIA